MCRAVEYLEKAAEFDELAKTNDEPVIKERYAELAESYRLLASVWLRLIASDIDPEQP
jgi:hypothetical protein